MHTVFGSRMRTALATAWRSVQKATRLSVVSPASLREESIGASPTERVAALERTLEECVAHWDSDHPHTITARNNLASMYSAVGRRGAAISQFERALGDAVRTLGEEHSQTEVIRENLAWCYQDATRFEEAAQEWERLVRQRTEQLDAHDPDLVAAHAHLALAYRRTDRSEAAIPHYERALSYALEASPGESESRRIGLALALESVGRLEEAGKQFQTVLSQRRRRLGPRHHQTLAVHHRLGLVYALAGLETEAVRTLQAVYRDCLAAAGDPEIRVLTLKVRRDLASAYRTAGRSREAAVLY